MAVLSPLYFSILLIARVALGIPWSARPAARYEGYDLERGPVLYEAYYPEEQQESDREPPKMYQEKRYFDRTGEPERSYQIPSDPYEIPYPEPELSQVREEYVQPDSAYLAPFTASRPQTVQNRVYGGQNKDFVFSAEQLSKDNWKSTIPNDYSFSNDGKIQEIERPLPFLDEKSSNFGDVQRIVPIDNEFIFGEEPIKKFEPDFKESFRNMNEQNTFETRNFGGEYSQQTPFTPGQMENIFQPRPQIIKYVFSSPTKTNNFKSVGIETEPAEEENDWPKNYGDNLIQGEIRKADEQELKKEEAKIASIEVSEVPHHKIRHHHGERPKRTYGHH
ncbi:uncharacterized protein LOC105692610 [Athalia rosae]|uniref:uncharacterized protein LOC105692610 n=1 Tax=Athalia rosae TaxID=37344 RepID=UPI002033FAEE|nr:uncharacterized protein LOC105692610 [Athalia rosae]